jgi:hypothetical protein
MRYLLHVPGETMMSLMSGALGMQGHASEAETRGDARTLPHRKAGLEQRNTWRHQSPSLPGGGPGRTW